ncbi:hypothetical protein K3495_g13481 [Podosphaera aphanis]|nr:hypothetical protein K3495_g13481 [Podosphaera aphanis]
MAAVSAPQATDVTTSSDSHLGELSAWKFPITAHPELPGGSDTSSSENSHSQRATLQGLNINPNTTSPEISHRRTEIHNPSTFAENAHLLSTLKYASASKNSSISDSGSGSANDSLLELYGPKRGGMSSIDLGSRVLSNGKEFIKEDEAIENSRWIHRDKLARIENQELQAAGIIIPKTRAASLTSSVRRKHSREMQLNNSRIDYQRRLQAENSPPDETESSRWDLRSPEEISENGYVDATVGTRSVSRIPVCVTSPLPIPMVHLERDTPLQRKKSGTWAGQEEGISYTKSRGRSDSVKDVTSTTSPPTTRAASESSKQKKPASRNRSASAHLVSTQRPQIRSGPSTKRPPSRGNELTMAANKRPEGDPPWLSTMYKPDPRLPPEEQLLPTVAKRLQQEQWEKEGTFGNIYDTSFRPLNDQPLSSVSPSSHETSKKRTPEKEPDAEWPLRSSKLSPNLSISSPTTTGGYSTMPKIIDPSPSASMLPSPRPHPLPQPPVEEKKKQKYGCCTIM